MSGKKTKVGGIAAVRLQYGALAYRIAKSGALEFLILTSRQTKRWIVPKGWPIKGMTQSQTAAREAYEEAGVRGVVRNKPIGAYVYQKFLDDAGVSVPCEIKIFALRVTRQEKKWPEKGQRDIRWVTPAEAAEIVGDIGLQEIVAGFLPKRLKHKKKSK